MPLITERKNRVLSSLQVEVTQKIEREIQQYCNWAGITDISYFIEEAAQYIFSNDEQWKKVKKEFVTSTL